MDYPAGSTALRQKSTGMPWLVRGDIDGFFGLAIDNLVQLLVIVALCRGVLGFSDNLIFGTILPGVAVSLVVGNVFYAWQAKELSRRTGRSDICALPYGINTVSLFAFIFLVMLPALMACKARGLGDEEATLAAWRMGLIACFSAGLIEVLAAPFAERLRRATPRAALLSTLGGIALGFISFSFLFRTYANPVVGLATLGVILLVYFGKVRFKGGLPGGFVAVMLGVALSFATGLIPPTPPVSKTLGLHFPALVLSDILAGLSWHDFLTYLSVIVPMGIFNVLGSLQNIESAAAAGDPFPTAPSLAMNGVGTISAALFGSCFPTTLYIGHPGWKGLGARAGYSILNAALFTVLCLTGSLAFVAWLIPIEAGMAIVLWIGIMMAAQSFEATPRHHAPAVVMGLLPGLGAWGVLMAKDGLRAGHATFSPALVAKMTETGNYIGGGFALEQGFIFTSMILSAVTVHLIEKRFTRASLWCLAAAALSAVGLMHSYVFTLADTIGSFGVPAWGYAAGYTAMAAVFLGARWLVVKVRE
jgi:AGZA family xanthine/uracil permease-like MFS transporter